MNSFSFSASCILVAAFVLISGGCECAQRHSEDEATDLDGEVPAVHSESEPPESDDDRRRELFDKVLDNPHLDAPRKEYARHLDERGDPRGKFIKASLKMAAIPPGERRGNPEYVGALARAELIWLENYREWTADIPEYVTLPEGGLFYWYHRGFLARVKLSASDWMEHHQQLLSSFPIQDVSIERMDVDFESFITDESLEPIRVLVLNGLGLTSEDVAILADSPAIAEVRNLFLDGNDIDCEGFEALIESDHLDQLHDVTTSSNPCAPKMIVEVDERNEPTRSYLNEKAKELERKHGRIEWLHHPYPLGPAMFEYQTDRYLEWYPPK